MPPSVDDQKVNTLGVDLASCAKRTATCVIEWEKCRASIRQLVVGADDDAITSLAGDADAVGIDAPFGWPAPFVETSWSIGRQGGQGQHREQGGR